MNKKILIALVVVLLAAVAGGLVYYFQGGNLQGLIIKGVPTCSSVSETVYSYTTATGHSQSFKYKSFNELFNAIKTELQVNSGKPLCSYTFTLVTTGPNLEREDKVTCQDKNDLFAREEDNARYLICSHAFIDEKVKISISESDYGFLMDVYYNYGKENMWGIASEHVRAQGLTVQRGPLSVLLNF